MFLRKLKNKKVRDKIIRDRLAEPLHLNLMSCFALFGGFRGKVMHDLVVRPHHAFALLNAADKAKYFGIDRVTAIEFGVANGAGLLNLCAIAEKVTNETGVEFDIIGYDTGEGMPPPVDFRDHPESYQAGDFPMNREKLEAKLPDFAKLVIGPISETLEPFDAPLGFASIDVDYYSSAVTSTKAFLWGADSYLPTVDIYLDDVAFETHSPAAGELLAVEEFNANETRKIYPHRMLAQKRLFRRAAWLGHMYTLHVLDHPMRQPTAPKRAKVVLENPYV